MQIYKGINRAPSLGMLCCTNIMVGVVRVISKRFQYQYSSDSQRPFAQDNLMNLLIVLIKYYIYICRFAITIPFWRYQRGNQNPYIDEEQTIQCPKEKVQMDKQRSTKHTCKAKDRVTRTPLKPEGELRCSGRVGSFCSKGRCY